MAGAPPMMPGGGVPGAPQLGPEAPMGAGMMASPGAGLPAMQPGNPQTTMMLGQIAAKLLQRQRGTKYAQQLLQHFATIIGRLQAKVATEFQNPQAAGDLASIIHKLTTAAEKLGKVGPSQSPQLTTALGDMVQRDDGMGPSSGPPTGG
jgi:hypothetical protein